MGWDDNKAIDLQQPLGTAYQKLTQIDLLEQGMTREQAEREFDAAFTEPFIVVVALAAAEWLRERGEAPSAGWLRLVGQAR